MLVVTNYAKNYASTIYQSLGTYSNPGTQFGAVLVSSVRRLAFIVITIELHARFSPYKLST